MTYWAFVPRSRRLVSPLVLIHGSRRNTGRMFRAFLPHATTLGMPLIVPTFPVDAFPGYQRLAGAAGPLSALRALESTLADADNVLGLSTDRVALCGFSGGAQFAHRFALYAPGRVRRVVAASAGYYTYLDDNRPFPYGIRPSILSAGERPDVEAFLRLPIHVLVGELDVERTGTLATGGGLDQAQGDNRLARALRWVDHLESVASVRHRPSRVSFDLLPGTAHSFTSAVHRGDLVSRVVDFVHRSQALSGAAISQNRMHS
ncbi:alpha/beta fold hydrolase [Cryobacterium tepidiphilum]|uniref:Alpha/beta hydrolase n=1 Tax=Cryobacterium tepidiphilum TaxID=2486026 RepID=A0A3M8LLQ6_9MICO|nr:alpha/beta hydrolase [Cryobacterium tepidiphilum]RNE66453.1 alpha/beta hydrolase [Cryobacterium tepidiphilum]